MSARAQRRGGVRAVAALVVLGALAVGCDSSDDDDGSTGPGPTGGADGGSMGAGDGTFAEILGRGPADEPVDFDAATLSADLGAIFGTAVDEPTDVTEGDDVDDVDTDGDDTDGDDADGAAGDRRGTASY